MPLNRPIVQPPAEADAPVAPLRLAIVEDDAKVRQLLHQFLGACPEFTCVAVVSSVEELWQELELSLPPELVLLDINLPGQSGLEALPLLRRKLPNARVLIQTLHDEADYIYAALQAGARGYVLKSATSLTEYRKALLQVASGGATISPSAASKLLNFFTPRPSQQPDLLSVRERQVLEGLVAGQTEKQIAAQLSLSATTVHTYVGRIYEKLQVNSRSELLGRAARGEL